MGNTIKNRTDDLRNNYEHFFINPQFEKHPYLKQLPLEVIRQRYDHRFFSLEINHKHFLNVCNPIFLIFLTMYILNKRSKEIRFLMELTSFYLTLLRDNK